MAELTVRPMEVQDVDVRINYFRNATSEHLKLIGVDPNKLGTLDAWRQAFAEDCARDVNQRTTYGLMWEADNEVVGFSTADRIVFGEQAYMHLHVLKATERHKGYGTELVRQSVREYLRVFRLARLYCEPHALNVAPNRTLQAAGFKYVSTQWTTPAPLNFEQVTNLWVFQSELQRDRGSAEAAVSAARHP